MKNYMRLFAVVLINLIAACKGSNNSTTAADSTQTSAVKKDTAVAASATPNVTKSANFEIEVPQGWRSEEKAMNGRVLLFLIGPVELGYQTNMNILKDPMKGESLDDYIKISLAKMQNMKVQMGASGDLTVNGLQGHYLKYIYNAPERMIVAKSYVFAKHDTAYVVSATTTPELGKKYEPVFDQAVNTLKIK